MDQDRQIRLSFTRVSGKQVEADFEGGNVTSDGGALFLREVDQGAGIIRRLASAIRDRRDSRYINHTLEELLSQRVFQIALGYEDANDCDELRTDVGLKVACGRLPITGEDLCSQATMTRLENGIVREKRHGIGRGDLYRMAKALVDIYIASYARPPKVIILDIDDTDDPTHGGQQLSLFNGYYDEHCFMPLHIYEGQSGKLITTILRPGRRPTGREIRAILKRLIPYLRKAWPSVTIFLRGDSHFSAPEVHAFCREQRVYFVLGQGGNDVLKAKAQVLLEQARSLFREGGKKVRLFTQFLYQADSWTVPLRVICKVEVSTEGDNIRFVVTNLESSRASVIYGDIYCARGRMENFIKDHKTFLHSDRTSCQDFRSNQFRLFLHSAAYVLLQALAEKGLKKTAWAKAQFNTLQNRILKVGAKVVEWKTKVRFHFPTSFPLKRVFDHILHNLAVAYPDP